jgi:hypothetical protein
MPLFDPEHEGSLAYLAAARLIYTPTKPQNAPEVVAAAPEEQSAASAPAEAVFEGNEFTVWKKYAKNASPSEKTLVSTRHPFPKHHPLQQVVGECEVAIERTIAPVHQEVLKAAAYVITVPPTRRTAPAMESTRFVTGRCILFPSPKNSRARRVPRR